MKRVALLLLLTLAPLARPALADEAHRRSHPARRHHAAASVGLLATLLLMPWGAFAINHSSRRDKARRPHAPPASPPAIVAAPAVNVTPPPVVNTPPQPAPVAAPAAPQPSASPVIAPVDPVVPVVAPGVVRVVVPSEASPSR